MRRGYIQKWLPPPTTDDYMWEVQQNMWWGNREKAKQQLMWLMYTYLGERDDEETALRKVEGRKGEEGEDVGVECH